MIAIDWGSTSLRAFRLDAVGSVREQRRSSQGIRNIDGRYAEVLRENIADWDDPLVVMAGMIGSRQGWIEAPYIACPAGVAEIAGEMQQVPTTETDGRDVWITPGLETRRDGVPDVMRGEETQICGVLATLPDTQTHTVLLPGTHSKRVDIAHGGIADFATAMTGEVFELLCEHSLLGKLMEPGEFDEVAFARGVAHAGSHGDLLAHMFATRTLGLLGDLRGNQLRSFLSGLLIGHELNDLPVGKDAVHLIGAPGLLSAYTTALRLRGIDALAHDELASARGLHALALERGLIHD